jgi:hypothetical protein
MPGVKRPDASGNYFCPRCEQWLGPVAFYKNHRTATGLSSWCKECTRKYQEYYNKQAVQNKGLPETPRRRRVAIAARLERYVDLEKLLEHFESGGGVPRELLPVYLQGEDWKEQLQKAADAMTPEEIEAENKRILDTYGPPPTEEELNGY